MDFGRQPRHRIETDLQQFVFMSLTRSGGGGGGRSSKKMHVSMYVCVASGLDRSKNIASVHGGGVSLVQRFLLHISHLLYHPFEPGTENATLYSNTANASARLKCKVGS